MNKTINLIKFICIIISYFSFSSLFAVDYFRHEYIIKENDYILQNMTTKAQACKESRLNNFQDKTLEERTVLIYLNTILDKVLLDNQNVLKMFGRKASEFCIDIVYKDSSDFSHYGSGLIEFNINIATINLIYGKHISDSYVVAAITHEISHDLLNHSLDSLEAAVQLYDNSSFKDKYKDINEYDFDGDLSDPEDEKRFLQKYGNTVLELRERYKIESGVSSVDTSSKEFIEYAKAHKGEDVIANKLIEEFRDWIMFYPKTPEYVTIRQKKEIEADNLGLQLYLNTGFKIDDFGKSRVYTSSYYNHPNYYPPLPDMFKSLSQNGNYITEGETAIKEKRLDEFMESIKYVYPLDYHPSNFWRYWNARKQLEASNINLNTGVVNGLYFKIDVSKIASLDALKAFLSNEDNRNLPIESTQDPRVYIIEMILHPNPFVSYTLEFYPNDRSDTGIVLDDNTILLKANDVFQISLIKYQSYNSSCIILFSMLKENPYEKIFSSIRKAFIQ